MLYFIGLLIFLKIIFCATDTQKEFTKSIEVEGKYELYSQLYFFIFIRYFALKVKLILKL